MSRRTRARSIHHAVATPLRLAKETPYRFRGLRPEKNGETRVVAGTETILPRTMSLQVNRPASNGADARAAERSWRWAGVRQFRVKPSSLSTSIRSARYKLALIANPGTLDPTPVLRCFRVLRGTGS